MNIFFREYEPDKSRVTLIACTNQYSMHHDEESDIVQHSESKRHLKNIETFSLDGQLITMY